MAAVELDALKEGSIAAFFELLHNERGVRLRCNLADTLLLRDGQPFVWLATNKEGYVVQRGAAHASLGDVRAHLVACALDGATGRCPPYVAIMRLADGTPKLLSRAALDALCSRLEAQLEAGEQGDPQHTPVLLQAYVPPFLDLRYVANYTNDGAETSCHTFHRRFSRRHLPYRDLAAPPQPGQLTMPGQGAADGRQAQAEAGVAEVVSSAADAARHEVPSSRAASCSEAMHAAAAGGGASGADEAADEEVAAGEGALADSNGLLGRAMGPVDPVLKMAARKAIHSLVQYVQKAHLLTLRGLAVEFVRDAQGHLWLLGPLRCDWASLMPGRGGEPWANANLMRQPRDEDSWQSEGAAEAEEEGGAAPELATPAAVAQPRAAALGSGQMHQTAGGASRLVPPSDEGERAGAAGITDSLLPPPALGAAADAKQPVSPAIPAKHSVGVAQPRGQGRQAGAAEGSPQKVAIRGSPRQKGPPGASLSPGSRGQQQLCASAPSALWASGGIICSGSGGCAGLSKRGPAVLTSHLTKELVSLQDELLVKADLADGLACKVETLEHDKHVITDAFERVLASLQGDLVDVRERLEALRRERDGLAFQLSEATHKLAGAEAERDQLQGMLNEERSTAFASLGQYHRQQEDSGLRAAKAEAELRSLQERLREEQAACDALKKQMVFYQHVNGMEDGSGSPLGPVVGDGGSRLLRSLERPEAKYAETLQAVEELLQREADPTGERYSLAKVLHTCQSDLHAIFLHYCLREAGFARHWPPQLTLQGWLAFMRDVGSTNLVPGMRTRSDNTMHVQEATEVFRRYCLRQAVARGTLPLRGPSVLRDAAAAATTAIMAGTGTAGGSLEHTGRPPSSQSTAPSVAATSRPFSAAASAPAGAVMNYQSFCAALVHVAAKLARGSLDALEACPFLSEQTRAFVELIVPKAQRVAPITVSAKKGGAASSGSAGPRSPVAGPAGSLGAKDAAAREAAAKLPKLRKSKGGAEGTQASGSSTGSKVQAGGSGTGSSGAGGRLQGEMSAIAEASREGSRLA